MGAEKLHTYTTMMGGPLRTGVCVIIWVVVVASAGAQPGDNLQAPDNTAEPFPTLGGLRRFINGPTSTSVATFGRLLSRTTSKGLENIGGRVEEEPSGTTWFINGHSYNVNDDVETRPRTYPANGQTQGMWRGEATQEGPHHPFADLGEQGSGMSGHQVGDERPDSSLSGPGENKSPPVPDVDLADWSRESSQWMYRDGEWVVVPLPDPAYPSLPMPPPPSVALVVATMNKVELERNVSGLANVTLHYRLYLSENEDPDTKPELKVYHVVNGTRTQLPEDFEQGEWYSRTFNVPQADNASILLEGWLKRDADVIALSNVYITGVKLNEEKPLDMDDQVTLTAGQPNTTESLTSAPTPEGDRTQDSPAPETSPATGTDDQDNNTTPSVPPAGTQVDPSSNSTTNTSQSPAEGEVKETPINSTDNPQNETQTSEQISGSMDTVALNSSMTGGDNATSGDSESDFLSSTTTTDEEESETDEGASTTTPVTDDQAITPEAVLVTDENTNASSTLSAPGVTTHTLQANTAVTLPVTSTTGGPLINAGIFDDRSGPRQPPAGTAFTDEGQTVSKNVFGDDDLTSGTTLKTPRFNGTSGNASPSGVTVSVEGTAPESTSLPSPASNSTEAVTAVPVSSTSWQVFQVFLVLCVMGLLALGFLYWKRKRRQDDEIPVFTRHTDYHNPTFSMEDAANFMSRAGRNTYKTIE